MKILLLGKNGQVGWELQRSLAPLGHVIALDRQGCLDLSGNLGDLDAIAATVRALKPDIIVNAAAYTAVDKAESEAALAVRINAQAPGVLARQAAAIGAWLIHYSTDYVFDGSGSTPGLKRRPPTRFRSMAVASAMVKRPSLPAVPAPWCFAPAGYTPPAVRTLPRPCYGWLKSATHLTW